MWASPRQLESTADFLLYFLNQVRENYDYIIVDTQPTRDSMILSNALVAADYVLIPMMCDSFSEDSAFRTYSICNELLQEPKDEPERNRRDFNHGGQGCGHERDAGRMPKSAWPYPVKTEIPSALP